MPLFAVISRALNDNLQNLLINTSFCFSYDDTFRSTNKLTAYTNLYRIDKRQAATLIDEATITTEFLKEMQRHDFAAKLATYLQHATTQPMMSPSDEEIVEKTGMVVGISDWHHIGTIENITALLQHTVITFKLGKTTQTVKLATLFQ